jgi:peptide/nickel transport system substrate-binding protein
MKNVVILFCLLLGVALAQPAGIASYASPSTFPDLDPSSSFSGENIAMANIYETLTFYTPDNQVVPKLATSWETSEDGLSWTFKLREGVTFHDGSPLNAEAVKGSLERTMALGLGAAFIFSGIESIEAVDDLTVKFNLSFVSPLDLILSSGYAAYIFSPAVFEQNSDWFNAGNDGGTGPYTIQSYSPGENLVLKAYEGYWAGWEEDQFAMVVFDLLEEPTLREQMIRSGEADFTYNLPADSYASLEGLADLVVDTTPSFQALYGLLNTQQAPLNDLKVRQALVASFPYDVVVENLYGGKGGPALGAVPSGMWGALSEGGASYDLDKAKSLLAEAGQDAGFDLTYTYAAGDLEEQLVGELWKAELAKLNINLDLQGLAWEAQWELGQSGPAGAQDIFTMYWWPTYVTPYDFLFSMFHSEDAPFFNLGYYRNADFDALIDEANALSGTDKEAATEKFIEAQQILNDDAAAVFMVETPDVHVIRSDISGYVNNPAYPHVVFWYELSR